MYRVDYDITGEWHTEFFNDIDEAFDAYERVLPLAIEKNGTVRLYTEDTKEFLVVCDCSYPLSIDEYEDDDDNCNYIEPSDLEMGFDPYMGCYTDEC